MDEFWIEPLTIEGAAGALRASFNDYIVTIKIMRKDNEAISVREARRTLDEVVARLPQASAR